MSNEMKTIEQIALEVSLPIERYKLGTVGVIELCKNFLAAYLEQQTPVAWLLGRVVDIFEYLNQLRGQMQMILLPQLHLHLAT